MSGVIVRNCVVYNFEVYKFCYVNYDSIVDLNCGVIFIDYGFILKVVFN